MCQIKAINTLRRNIVFIVRVHVIVISIRWWQVPKFHLCVTNSGCQIKVMTFICSVKVATNLQLIILIVARFRGHFDDLDMCMFSMICTPVDGCTICLDIHSNALHKFQFWNVPVLYWVVAFTNTDLCIHNS